jgi:hypothetical protein
MSIFNLFNSMTGPRKARVQHRSDRRTQAKPGLEPLEDRQLLSGGLFLSSLLSKYIHNNVIVGTASTNSGAGQVQVPAITPPVATTTGENTGALASGQTAGTATQTIHLLYGPTKTNWTQTQALAQFDPTKGTLTGVDIINSGSLASQIQVESLDQAPATVVGTVSGTITLTAPGINSLIASISSSQTFHAASFDGTIDFTGASGHDFGNKAGSGSKSFSLTSASDITPFIGTGTVPLTETALATSNASGAGNLLTLINSTASANVSVVYHYIPAPPVTVTGDPIPGFNKRLYLASTFRG